MSFEALGTPPESEPKFCPVCDSESHIEGWTNVKVSQSVNKDVTVHHQETVNGVLYSFVSLFDKDGSLVEKKLTRADKVRG